MYKLGIYILLCIVGSVFYSCSKESLEADIPAYLAIDKFTFTTNPVTQGSSSENITDAWVFIDDNLLGVYELPFNVPVLQKGEVEIKIFAGIKENGIAATRERYLFYTGYTETVTFVENETLKIEPKITYTNVAQFAWIEDFENASLSFTYAGGSDTVINQISSDVFEGLSSGKGFLTEEKVFIEARSPVFLASDITQEIGTSVFLELNFKTNEPLVVGLLESGGADQALIVNLNITTEWTKIYIDLTDAINSKPNATDFQVTFGMSESVVTPFISNTPEFFIDNIKLVHI